MARPVDGSIPVQALLYNDEELLASQDGVGIYYGSQKSPEHQNGIIHVTTHRLFYIDAQIMASNSFQMDLLLITQTDYYAGLFKSSPKVTCYLAGDPAVPSDPNQHEVGFGSWECEVCAYRNPPGLSPAAARLCSLCGVPRMAAPVIPTNSSQHLSSSFPSSVLGSLPGTPPEISKESLIACPACTFLNHSSLRSCEICSTDLPQMRREVTKTAPSSRPITPGFDDKDGSSIKISFRKGGDKPFYTVLKRSLKSKAWEETGTRSASTRDVNSINLNDPYLVGMSGISGILKTVETSAQGREIHMTGALQDLEALMVKAKDMVRLAAELNERLTVATTSRPSALNPSQPEEATFIRSSLSQLGLQMSNTPVTLDMMKDESKWFEELARELAGVLQGTTKAGIMKERGIIALDEVWGSWNRARGVALIPPSTFLQVIPHLPTHTEPVIRHRAFASGLNVLHTPPYTQAAFAARISSFLVLSGPKTTIEIAAEENLTVGLISEMMDAVEIDGAVCRDDSDATITGGGSGTSSELRWWGNLFVGYTWDGPE